MCDKSLDLKWELSWTILHWYPILKSTIEPFSIVRNLSWPCDEFKNIENIWIIKIHTAPKWPTFWLGLFQSYSMQSQHSTNVHKGFITYSYQTRFHGFLSFHFEVLTFSHIKVQDAFHSTLTDKYCWSQNVTNHVLCLCWEYLSE